MVTITCTSRDNTRLYTCTELFSERTSQIKTDVTIKCVYIVKLKLTRNFESFLTKHSIKQIALLLFFFLNSALRPSHHIEIQQRNKNLK